MLTLKTNNVRGIYELNLPTSLNEIDESYIIEVTSHIKVDANYTLVGLVYREKLSTLVLAATRNKKKSDIAVIPIFVKRGESDSKFINSLNIKDKLIISPSDIMMGYHISAPNNLLTINTILNLLEGDAESYTKLLGNNEQCYFIEFKLIPNCNIHGAYSETNVEDFVNPFVTKISDAPAPTIFVPKKPNIIV